MWYELWDIASGNLISDFDSATEAAEAALAYITSSEHGPSVDVSLMVCDDTERVIRSLEGEALVTWVTTETDQ